MKKSILFYFIALVISLITYIGYIFTYLSVKNLIDTTGGDSRQGNIFLIIIVAMIPLFFLSIWQMIKSLKNQHEVSMISIVILMINLIAMFGLHTYASISNYTENYENYSRLIEIEYSSELMINMYKAYRTNLIYTMLSGFIAPVVYLISSIIACIFKDKESKVE